MQQFKAGDRVMSPFTASCGACFYCRHNLTARQVMPASGGCALVVAHAVGTCASLAIPCRRCEKSQLFGWVEGGKGLHGAQAQYVRWAPSCYTMAPLPVPPAGHGILDWKVYLAIIYLVTILAVLQGAHGGCHVGPGPARCVG